MTGTGGSRAVDTRSGMYSQGDRAIKREENGAWAISHSICNREFLPEERILHDGELPTSGLPRDVQLPCVHATARASSTTKRVAGAIVSPERVGRSRPVSLY